KISSPQMDLPPPIILPSSDSNSDYFSKMLYFIGGIMFCGCFWLVAQQATTNRELLHRIADQQQINAENDHRIRMDQNRERRIQNLLQHGTTVATIFGMRPGGNQLTGAARWFGR